MPVDDPVDNLQAIGAQAIGTTVKLLKGTVFEELPTVNVAQIDGLTGVFGSEIASPLH